MKSQSKIIFFLMMTFVIGQRSPAETIEEKNIDVFSADKKAEILKLDKKINRSLFLPELSINTGLGKIREIDEEDDKGPYTYLDGRLNLYNSGRDITQRSIIEKQLSLTELEKNLKTKELKIKTFQLVTKLKLLDIENTIIQQEIKNNNNFSSMAKKKANAGLTSSVDLIDFEIKNENLNLELETIAAERVEFENELKTLYGNKLTLEEIKLYAQNLAPPTIVGRPVIQNTLQFKMATYAHEEATLNTRISKSQYLPTLDLEAKWGQITPHESLFSEKKEYQVALNLNIPLFTGFSTKSYIDQNKLVELQKDREKQQVQIDLEAKVENDLKNIDLLKKTLLSLEKSQQRANRYSDLTIDEYRRGIKNSPDLISASDQKYDLQRKILEAQNKLEVLLFSFHETFINN